MSAGDEARPRWHDRGMAGAAGVGLAAVVAEYGLLPPAAWIQPLRLTALAAVIAFALLQVVRLVTVPRPLEYLRAHRIDFVLLFVLTVQGLAFAGLADTPEARWLARHGAPSPLLPFYVAVVQVYVVAVVLARSPLLHAALVRIRLRPAQLLVASFAVLVALGTGLLALPGASRDGVSIGLLDALFTSTSAACVTGLVVRDTGVQFSTFGVAVIAALIQIGGLGILTFTATFALLDGRGLSGAEARRIARAADADADADDVRELRQTLGQVVLGTLAVEAVGAAALYLAWREAFPDPLVRAGQAAFHAVSAFCNAGFALFPGNASLTRFAADPATALAIGGLVVLGGLGFPVLFELARRGRPWSRHTRWVLASAAVLLVAGAVLLGVLEGMDPLAAAFQSVTLRTAGFNTVPLGALGLPAVAVCVAWMLVGGAPGGTAGGLKTTTALAALSVPLRRPRVDEATARRALRLTGVFLAAFLLLCAAVALAQGALDRRIVFEVASALGTVGLSMDYTPELGPAARLLVCVAMFAGRVGPFALAAAVLPWREQRQERPPEAQRILIG